MSTAPRPTDLACATVVATELLLAGLHPLAQLGWRDAVELLVWSGVALALRRAPDDWRGSPGIPAALVALAATLRAFPAPSALTFFAAVGALGVTVMLVRVLDDLLRGRGDRGGAGGLLVGPVTMAAVLGARADTLIEAHVGARLMPELTSIAVPLLIVAGVSAVLGALAGRRTPRSFFRAPNLPWAGLLPLLLFVPALAARHHAAPAPTATDRPPIVLLTVDTLRADEAQRMSAFTRVGGAYWPRAMSTASWTLPALASLHTGLLPREHGAGVLPGPRPVPILPEVRTLAERLRAHGYTTASFVTNVFTASDLGFGRGYDLRVHPEEDLFERRAFAGSEPPLTPTEAALRWIPSAPTAGVFVWVHLIEPHIPYAHPPTDPDDPLVKALGGDPTRLRASLVRSGMVTLDADAQASLRATYRRGCDDANARLDELLDAVDARWPDAIVVLTADHGEELFDHGGFEHGHSHHGEVLDVGLAIRGGGMPTGTRTDVASLADVMPTLLAMLGDPGPVDLRQEQPADRIVTADGNLYGGPGVSARQGDRRAILGIGEFDLTADPGELHPQPAGPLTDAAKAASGSVDDQRGLSLPASQLKALGYVE